MLIPSKIGSLTFFCFQASLLSCHKCWPKTSQISLWDHPILYMVLHKHKGIHYNLKGFIYCNRIITPSWFKTTLDYKILFWLGQGLNKHFYFPLILQITGSFQYSILSFAESRILPWPFSLIAPYFALNPNFYLLHA